MAKLKITQIKSRIGSSALQKKTLDALGLRKINQTVEHDDSAIILGMVEKVKHLGGLPPCERPAPAQGTTSE